MPVNPRSVAQVALPVEDVDRATRFYRDVLGLDFLFRAPPGLAFFRCGEVRLMLSRPEAEEGEEGEEVAPGAPLLYYRVDDVGAAHGELESAGADVLREPQIVHRDGSTELWIGLYRDSERNLFAVMEERAVGEEAGA